MQRKWEIQIGNSRYGRYNSKYTLKGVEHDYRMFWGSIDLWNLRGIEKLYNLEGDFEDRQNEWGDLKSLKNVADFEGEWDMSTSKGKEQEMENSQCKIKKLKKEIEKGEFGRLIICRSESQQDIDTQLDRWSGEFRKKESSG